MQITIVFRYPALAKLGCLESEGYIELAYLLYDCKYEVMINDARKILLEYYTEYSLSPDKLSNIDYHIEGRFGKRCSIEQFEIFLQNNSVNRIIKKEPIFNWKKGDHRYFLHFY